MAVPPTYWTADRLKKLRHLREVEKLKWIDIAARFPGCTRSSAKNRYARLVSRGQAVREPQFGHPPPRQNDDEKHLRLLLEALRKEHAA